jgi:hypothetical protein
MTLNPLAIRIQASLEKVSHMSGTWCTIIGTQIIETSAQQTSGRSEARLELKIGAFLSNSNTK